MGRGQESTRSGLVRANASQQLETFRRGKDEMNLAEFPIAVVAEAARPGQLTLHFADTIPDKASGRLLDRSVTVHGTEEWGLPAAHDDDVMVALLQIAYLSSWPKRIEFSRYELCQLLRWPIGGCSYDRIYKALHRLSTTTYNYRYAWRDHTNKEWIPSHVFSYIQSLKIHEAGRPTQSSRCEVTWSDDFHQSLLAGSLKRLNYDLFISLKSPIAKRLYRFLDKRFGAGRAAYSRDLHTLAFEKIGISRSYKDAAQIKRVLMPAVRELELAGFIAKEPGSRRFERVRRGQWRVHFRKKQRRQHRKTVSNSGGSTQFILAQRRSEGHGEHSKNVHRKQQFSESLVRQCAQGFDQTTLDPKKQLSDLQPIDIENLRAKAQSQFPGAGEQVILWAMASLAKAGFNG